MENILFAPDGEENLRDLKKFMHYADNLRVLGKLAGDIIPCIGCYKGKLENSFMCLAVDYDKYFTDWTKQQECIIRISSDTKQPAVLEYYKYSRMNDTSSVSKRVSLGVCKKVENPSTSEGWTYRKDTGEYFSF